METVERVLKLWPQLQLAVIASYFDNDIYKVKLAGSNIALHSIDKFIIKIAHTGGWGFQLGSHALYVAERITIIVTIAKTAILKKGCMLGLKESDRTMGLYIRDLVTAKEAVAYLLLATWGGIL